MVFITQSGQDWKVMALAKLESMTVLLDYFWEAVKDNVPPTVRVRKSWSGTPDWSCENDVIFVRAEETNNEDVSQAFDAIWVDRGEDLTLTEGATRVIRLTVTGYGPTVYNHICTLRQRLLRGIRSLREHSIYAIMEPDTVVYAPELFQGRWWPRTDLSVRFNVLTIFDTEVNAVCEVDFSVSENSQSARTIDAGPIVIRKDINNGV